MKKVMLYVPQEFGSISITAIKQSEESWITLTSDKVNQITAVRVIKEPSVEEISKSLEHFYEIRNES